MMLFQTSLAALAALLPLSVANPTPLYKRYTAATIRSYRTNTCLTLLKGTVPSNGVLLTTGDCATATKWDINPGSGSVIATGTNFALDAGTDPHNNVPAKVWQSYPGLTQQTWYLTGDNRIAITGGNQCLDQGDSGPQTYQCTSGNTNQIWYVQPGSSTPSSSASRPPTSSTSSQPPAQSSNLPGDQKYTLRWKGNFALCVSVQGRIASGGKVELQPCDFTPVSPRQNWVFFPGANIQLAETGLGAFCLESDTLQNGGDLRIRPCVYNKPAQTWNYPNSYPLGPGNGIFQTSNNQCLDINNQGNTQVQTWQCSAPDPQQQFIFIPV